jgi:hypothetical protein
VRDADVKVSEAVVYEDRKEDQLRLAPNGMSIDLLRAVYRNPSLPLPVRMRAAIAALPHEVPRLQVSAQLSENDFAILLDQRIKRHEAKLIEHQQPIASDRTLPRIPDRRFRRI